MQRIAVAALALLAATVGACGGMPTPPQVAQLVEDVRQAMDTAPSFRFESTWTNTNPVSGESITEIAGEIAGDGVYTKSGSLTDEFDWVGETLFVEGDVYTRSTPPPASPFSNDWRPSNFPQAVAGQASFRARVFSIPENLADLKVIEAKHEGTDVWILTGERIATVHADTSIQYSISPKSTYSWTIDPKTSRLIAWERVTDYGIVTFPPEMQSPPGPQKDQSSWRIFDYDVDITITVPPNVTPLPPTATPRPGGEDVDYTFLMEAAASVTPDEWDATIAILEQRFRGIPGGIHLEWVGVGEVKIRLSAHTLTVRQLVAIATPKGHFEIIERQCESYFCEIAGTYVDKPTRLTNGSIASASSDRNTVTGQLMVTFEMTRATAQALADLTTRPFETNAIGSTPDQMAVVLDGETLVSAVVSSPIMDGSGQINGGFTEDEAQVIAALIANPPLPVGLRLVSAEAQ
jgi:hypothetical protein